jgi:hypothetical protein
MFHWLQYSERHLVCKKRLCHSQSLSFGFYPMRRLWRRSLLHYTQRLCWLSLSRLLRRQCPRFDKSVSVYWVHIPQYTHAVLLRTYNLFRRKYRAGNVL